jgi:DNA repair photolyase
MRKSNSKSNDQNRPTGDDFVHPIARRGRGAVTNAAGRFEPHTHYAFDDGWSAGEDEVPTLRTTVQIDATRTIIARNKSPDISFDRSINPYRGCEHGCIYCFARPTHAYLGLSPGLDFESRLFAKPNAPALLEAELGNASYKPRVIAMGTNTDPYQPIERRMEITRGVLSVLSKFNHPVAIVTKADLILRDLDILRSMAKRGLAKAAISVTSLDHRLSRKMEPRATAPAKRLAAIKALSQAGVPTAVMVAPIIPALNDSEIEDILRAANESGATEAGYVLLRLPFEIKDLFQEWLDENFPDRASHVMTLIRGMRRGREYDAQWGQRMVGSGPYADMIAKRFRLACKHLEFSSTKAVLDSSKFERPPPNGQMKLL